jgi:CheY-like chemotaxis protein
LSKKSSLFNKNDASPSHVEKNCTQSAKNAICQFSPQPELPTRINIADIDPQRHIPFHSWRRYDFYRRVPHQNSQPDPANRLYKHVMNHEIFVVDDNADYQFLFFKLIKELHKPYSVKFFEHGKALHQHVVQLHTRQAGQLPALVVSDFNMPGMNGLQLLKMLKTTIWDDHVSLREIPVVIMSNDISEHQILQCYQAGANAVVLKPIDFEVMKTTVRSICEFWLDRGTYAGGGVPV